MKFAAVNRRKGKVFPLKIFFVLFFSIVFLHVRALIGSNQDIHPDITLEKILKHISSEIRFLDAISEKRDIIFPDENIDTLKKIILERSKSILSIEMKFKGSLKVTYGDQQRKSFYKNSFPIMENGIIDFSNYFTEEIGFGFNPNSVLNNSLIKLLRPKISAEFVPILRVKYENPNKKNDRHFLIYFDYNHLKKDLDICEGSN